LASEINASTASDPLWIIGAGPMHVIGMAMAASDSSKHQFVHLVSHSSWNEEYQVGDSYTWAKMKTDFPTAHYHDIEDQNTLLNADFPAYHWLRDSGDVRLRWLWARSQPDPLPEFAQFVGGSWVPFFDASDSGMMYWMLTGDEQATPEKLRWFFGYP
jgi:hypothetical protein